jgi:hypothetical protein
VRLPHSEDDAFRVVIYVVVALAVVVAIVLLARAL